MEGYIMKPARITNSLFPVFPSFIDKFFEGNLLDMVGETSTLPAINILNNDDDFVIEVAAPGMSKDDFNITYDNGELTITSERKSEKTDENDRYTRREFNYQSFRRSFNFSEKLVQGDKVEACYTDGILSIKLPKREEVKPKPPRAISIS